MHGLIEIAGFGTGITAYEKYSFLNSLNNTYK